MVYYNLFLLEFQGYKRPSMAYSIYCTREITTSTEYDREKTSSYSVIVENEYQSTVSDIMTTSSSSAFISLSNIAIIFGYVNILKLC